MTLIEVGGVRVDDVRAALAKPASASFGDGTGTWHSVAELAFACGQTGGSQGGTRSCLDYLVDEGDAHHHPQTSDFWQAL